MFREIVEKQQAKFFAKQSELIKAMGDNFKELIARMPAINGMNYGDPPYIVDDGEDALLLVDQEGRYSRLLPGFALSEDSVKEGYDALYSLPVLGIGLIRLIPANVNYEFPEMHSSTPLESDDGFFLAVDELFATYIDGVMALSKESVAIRLIGMKRPLLDLCENHGISLADVLQTPSVVGNLFSIFCESLAKASDRVAQIATGLDGQDDEDCDQG